jgi:hypothetical protein
LDPGRTIRQEEYGNREKKEFFQPCKIESWNKIISRSGKSVVWG